MLVNKREEKGLDGLYYYNESLDTTFVLKDFFMTEYASNVVYYQMEPVYGYYDKNYLLSVAYFESFNDARKKCGFCVIEDVNDISYRFEQ